MNAPLAQPHARPLATEKLNPAELVATLEQMVARCDEMVDSLLHAALVVRNDPPRPHASNQTRD